MYSGEQIYLLNVHCNSVFQVTNGLFITGGKELTDEMLLNVALEINKKSDVLKLGVKGLKMKASQVETSLHKNKDDLTMAMYDVLKTWRASYGDFKVAYVDLSKALKAVKMNSVIQEAL